VEILILEDNVSYAKFLKKYLTKNILFANFTTITTFNELKNHLDKDLYIVDYNLPDANGEQIDFLLENKKDVILISGTDDDEIRKKYGDKIIDYIVKEDISTLEYLVRLLRRLQKNKNINILLVEDSSTMRNLEKYLLKRLNLNVITANNGDEALKIYNEKKDDIDLIITDIHMPGKDGIEIVKEIRHEKRLEELPILVISSDNTSAKALKKGANDFIRKPFEKEEFIVRVNNLLETYDYIKKYKKETMIDPLTGAYNRMFLQTKLDNMFKIYDTKSIAMLDIDHFKKINDTFGHQKGDEILKIFVKVIKSTIRSSDVLVRYGGEEFLVFMPNTNKKEAFIVIAKIRAAVHKNYDFTFSAGIADEGKTLAESISLADERLYQAKRNGRDRIVI
jgi:diguanylate cyclase (GGDEF)-like protein